MSARLAPSLQSILYRLVGVGVDDVRSLASISAAPGRFPVVVKPETRAFLEAQAKALGGSMAGIAGAILDGVAATTLQRDGGAVAMRGVVERFNLLLQEHELSVPAAASALSSLGFSLRDFASFEAQQARLDADTILSVAERFFVAYDWLAVRSDEPTHASSRWYKKPEEAADTICAAVRAHEEVELVLLVPDEIDTEGLEDRQSNLSAFIPILKRSSSAGPLERLKTYEVWEEGRWDHEPCREQIKLVVHFMMELSRRRTGVRVTGCSTPRSWYQALSSGNAMAATLLRSSSRRSWHPDDYVMPDSRVAKGRAEWLEILAAERYASVLGHFDRLKSDF